MSFSSRKPEPLLAQGVIVTTEELLIELIGGGMAAVPLSHYPRLQVGSPLERSHWQLIGQGAGIHWPDLDEDVSVENIVAGKPSVESKSSFTRWRLSRQ